MTLTIENGAQTSRDRCPWRETPCQLGGFFKDAGPGKGHNGGGAVKAVQGEGTVGVNQVKGWVLGFRQLTRVSQDLLWC